MFVYLYDTIGQSQAVACVLWQKPNAPFPLLAAARPDNFEFTPKYVNTKDAHSLRFLWKEDVFADGPPNTYQMLVHIFGAKCSPACCSYALKRTGRDAAPNFDALTFESVVRDFYMDDLLKSVKSEDHANQVAKELISMVSSLQICQQ